MEIKNSYTFTHKICLAWYLLRTKLICHQARLIRFPFTINGRKYIDLGKSLTTGVGCRLDAYSKDGNQTMFWGNNVQINDYVHICSMNKVKIGNNVLMASHIFISDNSHGSYKGDECDTSPDIVPMKRKYHISSVEIGDNVWIGEHVVVMPGVRIGKGSVIGANSVVSRDIPDYTVAVGQPAIPIKKYDFTTEGWIKI